MISYYNALDIAFKAMTGRPYILCGSVALIWLDVIPVRNVNNVNFICSKESFDYFLPLSEPPIVGEGYSCYRVCEDDWIKYDVFVFDDSNFVRTFKKDTILFQEVDQMLQFFKGPDISGEFLL